ncbi:uncharacterized protein CLUP02_02802 [Colletotrichum lupini]|uniref:Uncharacterized protein n=1 Tax=Colletotrichum lupini TaxID=145971 RepID=A0A9Q8WBL5_9PEZI|nr:uncharacterized protein CLUP02_02802 [Colletotrichum lupini]UQC77334.1 hypothetical protein CLUP02_02802 [Colletotrichum lupini]
MCHFPSTLAYGVYFPNATTFLSSASTIDGPLDIGIRCIHRRVDMLSFEGQNIALFQDETYVRSSSTSSSVLSKRCTTCQRSSNDVFQTRLRRSISPTRPRGLPHPVMVRPLPSAPSPRQGGRIPLTTSSIIYRLGHFRIESSDIGHMSIPVQAATSYMAQVTPLKLTRSQKTSSRPTSQFQPCPIPGRPTASIILCTSQSQSPMPSTQPQSRPVYPIACRRRRRRRRRRLRADRMILIHPGAMEKPGPSSRFI